MHGFIHQYLQIVSLIVFHAVGRRRTQSVGVCQAGMSAVVAVSYTYTCTSYTSSLKTLAARVFLKLETYHYSVCIFISLWTVP